MSPFLKITLTSATAAGLVAGTMPAQAAPLPALAGVQVGGQSTNVETVGWRRGYYGRRGGGIGGALVAGAAIGLIGTAIAASARPRYGYYGYSRPAYGYGYPAYGYRAPGYGYAPAYGYGYPYAW